MTSALAAGTLLLAVCGGSTPAAPTATTAAPKATLYIFKNDVAGNGKSVCNGGCATNWPPLKAPDAAPSKGAGVTGDLSVVTRDDGTKQIAYKGLPLYFFQADQAVGYAKGTAIANWALALP